MGKKTTFAVLLVASFVSVILNLSTFLPIDLVFKPVVAQDLNSIVNDAMVQLNETRVALQGQNITLAMAHLDQIEKDLTSLSGTMTNSTTVQNQSNMVIDKNLPTNTVQLNAKEKKGVYTWGNKDGTNPVLSFKLNTNNIVQIKNPTDSKHELVITSGGKEAATSGDIAAGKSSKLTLKTLGQGESFEYHCEYHPTTMKGTITISP
jgi:plastocyanin